MRYIDLTKLRPGDLIFTMDFHWKSFFIAGATASRLSHAVVVVYPDIWFETDGRGSGYRVYANPRAFYDVNHKETFVVPVTNLRFKARRLTSAQPNPHDIITAIRRGICLQYPLRVEFLPLAPGFRSFPAFTDRIVELGRIRAGRTASPHCSQLVLSTMQAALPMVAALTHDNHISPGRLYRRVKPHTTDVTSDVLLESPLPLNDDATLAKKFSSLAKVTERLADFQYPTQHQSQPQRLWRGTGCCAVNPGKST
jgi:hypothetical protein